MIWQISENELAILSILARYCDQENEVDSHASAVSFVLIIKFYGCLPTFFGAPVACKIAHRSPSLSFIDHGKKFSNSATIIDAQLDREMNFAIYSRRIDCRSRKLSLLRDRSFSIDLSSFYKLPFHFTVDDNLESSRTAQAFRCNLSGTSAIDTLLFFSLTFLYTCFLSLFI